MSFLGLGGSSSTTSAPIIAPEQQKIIDQIKSEISQEIATTYASSLVNALSENCFEKCIKTPTNNLDGIQDKCISDCSAKFMRAWNVISRTYVSRINQK
jgi:import inner membrane translocase subunit TIM13